MLFADVPQIDCDVKAAKILNPEFIAKCPPGCQDVKYRVYGTDIYASFSSICGAAIHRLAGLPFSLRLCLELNGKMLKTYSMWRKESTNAAVL